MRGTDEIQGFNTEYGGISKGYRKNTGCGYVNRCRWSTGCKANNENIRGEHEENAEMIRKKLSQKGTKIYFLQDYDIMLY